MCIRDRVVDEEFYQIDDFFELFLYAAERKRDVLERFPFLMEFSIRAFYPDHKDIKDTMDNWNWSKIDLMFNTYFKNVRFDRFRDDVDPRYVVDLMIWLADGYMHQQRALRRPISIDGMMDEMRRWCEMLRAYAYKEEYR